MKQKISTKRKAGKENPAAVAVEQATPEVIQQTVQQQIVQHIDLSMIVCNPFNPRRYSTQEDLRELTQSIVNYGIIQPVTVRRKEEKYEIVCGERRFHACVEANLATLPAIVREYSDEEAMEICILENLQRRDINPVEEAVSFGKLMEVRKYSIDDLVKQFGKTDKYIRSRLQLRNLTDDIANLLVKEEITLAIALELARFCPNIQKHVFENHLSKEDTYSWKNLSVKEFRRLLENGYSADLAQYEFDKGDCKICQFNSSLFDLFADGNGGHCQNLECLQYKQGEYVAYEATKMLAQAPGIGICVAPNSFASAEVVENLIDTGCEIYEMAGTPLPVEPQKPQIEQFESEDEYLKAESSYKAAFELYSLQSQQIETMVAQGTAQLLVDVGRRKPEMCYRVVSEAENLPKQQQEDTLEKLRNQDKRNREIAFEKGVEDIKKLLKESTIPSTELQQMEEDWLYYCMFASLRKESFAKFGFDTETPPTEEEKAAVIASLTDEQKNILKRDFIIHRLCETTGNGGQSHLLMEFATLHFPDKVKKIKEVHNDSYLKKHLRIEERIREIQPFVKAEDVQETIIAATGQTVQVIDIDYEEVIETDPETFHESDTDDAPLYPELPERANIGEIPEEDEHLGTVVEADTEIAA